MSDECAASLRSIGRPGTAPKLTSDRLLLSPFGEMYLDMFWTGTLGQYASPAGRPSSLPRDPQILIDSRPTCYVCADFEMIFCAFQTEMLAILVLATFIATAKSKTGNGSIAPLSIPPSAFWYDSVYSYCKISSNRF